MRIKLLFQLLLALLVTALSITPAIAFDMEDVFNAFDQDSGRPSPKKAMEWAKITVNEISGFTVNGNVKLNLVEGGEIRKIYVDEIKSDPTSKAFLEDSTERQFVLKTLGVISENEDILAKYTSGGLDMLAGFYSTASKEMTLVKRIETESMQQTLLHELTHAGQDEFKDIAKLERDLGDTFDSSMALRAFLEGQAQLVTSLAYIMKYDQNKYSPKELLSKGRERIEKWWDNEKLSFDDYFQMEFYFPYVSGAAFATTQYLDDVTFAKMFEKVPRTTEQLFDYSKFRAGEKRKPTKLETNWANIAGKLGHPNYRDTLGQFVIESALQKLRPDKRLDNRKSATGWGGDHVAVWGKGNKRYFIWDTAWDSRKDAMEFSKGIRAAVLNGTSNQINIARNKNSVIIIGGAAEKRNVQAIYSLLGYSDQ